MKNISDQWHGMGRLVGGSMTGTDDLRPTLTQRGWIVAGLLVGLVVGGPLAIWIGTP